MPLTSREMKLIVMREEDKRTFRDIAKELGVSAPSVQKVYVKACYKRRNNEQAKNTDSMWGLGVRPVNIFFNLNIRTRTEIAERVADGRIKPGFARDYGPATHLEVLLWLDRGAL